ncbi:Methionine synthase [Sporomusa carbonis]
MVERYRQILEKLRKSVEEMEASLAEKAAREAIAAGTDPIVAINEGLARGMKTISDLFDEGEAFVPHLLVAAEAFEMGVAVLTKAMARNGKLREPLGKVLIYTVQGDIHDIGKNIVKTMLGASGFEVIDLGRDVATPEVVSKAKEYAVDIIVATALMRTTMPAQRDIIEALKEEGIRGQFKCMFGGAPVSVAWVEKIGGDAYAATASEAVEKAKVLMAEKRAVANLG